MAPACSLIPSNNRPDILPDPVENPGKAKFMPVHGAIYKVISGRRVDLDVKAIAAQKNIGGGKGDALVSVRKP